jgi:hypothetical protein
MRRLILSCCLVCAAFALARAQTEPGPAAKTPAPAKAKGEKVDPLEKERRAAALNLVNELADEARSYRDEQLRARVQTRAADLLWDVDQEKARALFLRAWDAADSADREAQRKIDEQYAQRRARGEGFAYRAPPNLRNEVLRAAARRDRALGEELIAKLEESRKTNANATNQPDTGPAESVPEVDGAWPPPAVAQRLEAAAELLRSGDVERALQFADPGLLNVSIPALQFLVELRNVNQPAADQRYAALLARAANAPNTTASTVSLLASYVFTPRLFLYVTPNGGLNTTSSGPAQPIDAPALRTAFLNFAAGVLSRPLPTLDQPNAKGRRTAVFLVASRLLPLFEQFAPDYVGVLRAQVAAVTADVDENVRDPRNPWLTRGLVPENQERNESETALERAEREKDPEQRDSLYAMAAINLLRKDATQAYNVADKIADTELRKSVRSYLDFNSLARALNKKDAAEALRLARKGELSGIQRVWGLTETSRLLVKTDRPQAAQVLEEAATETRRIGGSDPNRVCGLVAVATRLYELDPARAWEYLNEAVKAANSNGEYTGEDGQVQAGVRGKSFGFLNNTSVDSFDLQGLFGSLTKEDLTRAVQTAKNLTPEAARANALLAIVRQVLGKKGQGVDSRREERSATVEN